MKQISIILIIGFFFTHYSCKKYEQKSIISGDKTIIGQVFIMDTLSSNMIPLSNAVVKLGTDSINSADFIISDTTDQNGFFKFSNLNINETKIYLFVNYLAKTTSYNRYFYARTIVDKNIENYVINLQPDPAYGKYLIQAKISFMDLFSNSVLPASKCIVIISPQNESFNQNRITASAEGIAYFSSLKEDLYHINFSYTQTFQSIPITFNLDTVIQLSGEKLDASYNLTVYPKTIAALITFAPAESPLTPQSGVTYCIFSSRKFFLVSDCSKSNSSGQSNAYGKALIDNVSVGAKYYISAFDSLKNLAISAKDSFTISADNTTLKTILLK